MTVRSMVRVVSLPDTHARRTTMTQRLSGSGLDWSFFDARRTLDPELTYSERSAWIAHGRPMTRSQLGCYSSHHQLWQEFLAGTATQLLVLEDDVNGDWEYLREHVLPFDFGAIGIDFLRLFGIFPSNAAHRRLFAGKTVYQMLSNVCGTQAYILTRNGAATLVRHCRKVERPIDDTMDQGWVHGVHAYGLFPYPIVELRAPTQIADRDIHDLRKNPFPLRRLFYRAVDKYKKSLYPYKENTRFFRTHFAGA